MPNHIAILLKPYIRMILDGRKSIESRLTRTPLPPFRAIESGDRIFLKASSGPFMATAIAGDIEFHDHLTPTKVAQLKRRLNERVCGDEQFWQWKRDARFATFITLRDVEPIDVGPPFEPSRGPAWFVLPDSHPIPAVFDVELTDGAIRNRYVRVPRKVPQFKRTWSWLGWRTPAGSIQLSMPDARVIETQVLPNRMIRWRGWSAYFDAHAMKPGDRVRFVQVGDRRFRVRFIEASV